MRLTKRVVDSTEKSSKDIYVWDTDLKGFGLKVTPTGRKVYLVQYRIGGARPARGASPSARMVS